MKNCDRKKKQYILGAKHKKHTHTRTHARVQEKNSVDRDRGESSREPASGTTGEVGGAVQPVLVAVTRYSLQEIKSGRGNYNFPGVDFSRTAVNKGVE